MKNELCPQPAASPAPAPSPSPSPAPAPQPTTVIKEVPASPVCTVPNAKGLTTAIAKRLFQAGGCNLGTVTRKKVRKRSQIGKVLSQKVRAQTKLASGAKIGVTIGRR